MLVVVLAGCEQSPTKPDAKPKLNLAETYNLAAAAYKEQDWVEGEKQYFLLTREAPEEFEPWFKLGNIYARTQRFDRAIACYREALIRDSRNAKAWHNMAVTQLRDSGKSFLELEMLVEDDDPLHEKSIRIQQSIEELLD